MNMTRTESETATADLRAAIRGFLLEIGTLTFPVYGDATIGWSIIRRDVVDKTPYRYGTFDELVFALLNYSLVAAGEA